MALKPTEKKFVEEYIRHNYNATQTYLDLHPGCAYTTANNAGPKIMKNPECVAYMKELQKEEYDALGITAERIAKELASMAFAELDENNSVQSKARALELLQKQLGLHLQKMDVKTDSKIEIKVAVNDEG